MFQTCLGVTEAVHRFGNSVGNSRPGTLCLLPSTRPAGSGPDQAGQDADEATPSPPVGVVRSRACASPLQSAAPSRLVLPLSPTPPVGDLLESRPQGRAPQPDSRAPDRGRPRPWS